MKKSKIYYVLLCVVCLCATPVFLSAHPVSPQHGFGIEEYDRFHDVLHPLEHEALPNKDFRKIRSQAALLVAHGRAILKIAIPAQLAGEQRENFVKEMKTFKLALDRFRADSRRANNTRLKKSYSAVHDSFETLAAMLPR